MRLKAQIIFINSDEFFGFESNSIIKELHSRQRKVKTLEGTTHNGWIVGRNMKRKILLRVRLKKMVENDLSQGSQNQSSVLSRFSRSDLGVFPSSFNSKIGLRGRADDDDTKN